MHHADDVVLMAKEEGESMLERYLDRKGLELNVGKTKVFREKGERMNWKGKKIEKVKEYKYLMYIFLYIIYYILMYIFQRNEEQEKHIRERIAKETIMDQGREDLAEIGEEGCGLTH